MATARLQRKARDYAYRVASETYAYGSRTLFLRSTNVRYAYLTRTHRAAGKSNENRFLGLLVQFSYSGCTQTNKTNTCAKFNKVQYQWRCQHRVRGGGA